MTRDETRHPMLKEVRHTQQGQAPTRNKKEHLLSQMMTEFRQPLQVQSHLEMPRILVQLGHIQRT